MSTVDALIERIRDRDDEAALTLLNAEPQLAREHSSRDGQLHGASPLHWAAHRNSVRVCERLLELGAEVNDSASDWWLTPLSWAADAASVEVVELLLARGADVNQDAVVGTTALDAAAMGGSSRGARDPEAYRRTAEVLLAHGASVDGLPERKRTPLDESMKSGNAAVEKVLRANGGRASEDPSGS
ncbi:MAG: ankyrin repeat domain-containing protein [Planctomycetota bacterium]